MVPRAMYYGFRELQFVDGFAQISEQFYLQALFGSAAFVLSFILMLVVFTGSFLIFRHREQQSLREIGYPDGNTLRSWSRPGAQDI